MGGTLTMPAEQQAALLHHADAAIDALIERLLLNRGELSLLALKRASSIGASEYGVQSYAKTAEVLDEDVDEELADAIFYQHITLMRRHTDG